VTGFKEIETVRQSAEQGFRNCSSKDNGFRMSFSTRVGHDMSEGKFGVQRRHVKRFSG